MKLIVTNCEQEKITIIILLRFQPRMNRRKNTHAHIHNNTI